MSTELRDGQLIFELGCGWGFLTLWMAAHFANRRITAVANANCQREYIQQQARATQQNGFPLNPKQVRPEPYLEK